MKKYIINANTDQLEAFDEMMFTYNLDDVIWFEDGNSKIVTENPKAEADIEKILNEIGLEFTVE